MAKDQRKAVRRSLLEGATSAAALQAANDELSEALTKATMQVITASQGTDASVRHLLENYAAQAAGAERARRAGIRGFK